MFGVWWVMGPVRLRLCVDHVGQRIVWDCTAEPEGPAEFKSIELAMAAREVAHREEGIPLDRLVAEAC